MTSPTVFDIYHERMRGIVDRMARSRARGDRSLADDLRQEGLIALWRASLRSDRVGNDNYLIRCVSNRMRSWLRREREDQFTDADVPRAGAGVPQADAGVPQAATDVPQAAAERPRVAVVPSASRCACSVRLYDRKHSRVHVVAVKS